MVLAATPTSRLFLVRNCQTSDIAGMERADFLDISTRTLLPSTRVASITPNHTTFAKTSEAVSKEKELVKKWPFSLTQ